MAQRVLVVSSELPPGPGGIGAHAHAVAVELAGQGRDVALLGCQHYASVAEREAFNRAAPVPITTFSDRGDPLRSAAVRLGELQRLIASFRPDVVLASGGRVLWLASLACRRAGVPFVAVAHGTELGGAPWHRRLTRMSLDRSARVIAVSQFTAGLVQELGVRRPTIDVVPNGADATRFGRDAARRKAFRSAHDLGARPIVLTVGNVTERKGQHLVVEALPRLVAAAPDVSYVLVGRPTEADALQARARALGVDGHLVVLGQLDAEEVADAHAAADVFAMTSTNTASGDVEGFGIAVLEAALSGVPAVVTKGTGAEEAVRHGETGLAVESEPARIADALTTLLTDPHHRAELGDAAERHARDSGTWTSRVEQYGEILDEVARGALPRMVVVSHTEHWRADDAAIVGFGATTRELDHLATLASELVHVAPLHPGPPPRMALPSRAPNVRHVLVPTAGGNSLVAKLGAARAIPRWTATINREVATADVVHVRCPAGIAIVALAVLAVRRQPRHRWIKYAGNWAPTEPDARTYRLQRWWLRRGFSRAAVTVNGKWPDQPPWVTAFDNPTLTESELDRGREAALDKEAGPPWRAVFAGRLSPGKGADRAVKTVLELRSRGLDVTLDLIGDGPLRSGIEQQAREIGHDVIRLHGWMPRSELEKVLARGHVFLLPTASEGFPKVVAEAMAFGCVPVTSSVGSLGQTLGETGGAVVITDADTSWTDTLELLLSNGDLAALAADGIASVERFSFRTYLGRVRELASTSWGRSI